MPEIKKYLSKDGLENYNELLPHSATQMQEYVSDWLDEHPEATTTVQDDSITTVKLKDDSVTTPKIADEAVTTPKLSQDVYKLITGNVAKGTASGDIVSVDDAWSANPIQLVVDGRSTQDGTPTPDAPVPIKSVDELTVMCAGKNLLDAANPSSHVAASYSYEDGTLTVTSTHASTWSYVRYDLHSVGWLAGKYVTLYVDASSSGTHVPLFSLSFHKADGTRITYRNTSSGALATVVPDGTELIYAYFYVRNTAAGEVGDTTTYSNIQLELGSTATAYEPYEGHNVPIPLQGNALRSLPNGTKDKLTLSWLRNSTREGWAWYSRSLLQRVDEVDLGTLVWSKYGPTQTGAYTFGSESLKGIAVPASSNDAVAALFSPLYPAASFNAVYRGNNGVAMSPTTRTLIFNQAYSSKEATAQQFMAAMSGVLLYYELVTPITHTLDPIELPILPAPTCTVWSDPTTGLILTYERDLTIALEKIEQAIADQ